MVQLKALELSPQEFRQSYGSQNKPVVIKGGVAHWPALQRWNLDYLKNTLSGHKVNLAWHHSDDTQWDMEKFLEALGQEEGRGRYLTNADILQHFPELKQDVAPYSQYALPDWSASGFLPKNMHYNDFQAELLLGGKGTNFPLHYDRGYMHAFVGQVVGRKKVIFIAPEEGSKVYPTEKVKNLSSIADVWKPDYEKFPKFKSANVYEVVLEPGDLAFIPSGWWHATMNLELSMAVTFNQVTPDRWLQFIGDFCFSRKHLSFKYKLKGLLAYPYLLAYGCLVFMGEKLFSYNVSDSALRKVWGSADE